MITIQSAESALKNIYLDSVINDINTKTNPFLTMVQKNAKNVNGKEARVTIRYGNEASVATGVEGGALPVSSGKAAEIVVPVKNLYGTFQISDKAIRSAQNNPGAFASLLASEMQNLVGTAQTNLNAMVYGNGKKFLGITEAITATELTVPTRYASNFSPTQRIRLMTADNVEFGPVLTVTTVSGNRITVTGTVPVANARHDRFYIYADGNFDTELNGIDSIFMNDAIYNLPLVANSEIAPCIVTAQDGATVAAQQVLGENEVMRFFGLYEDHCQSMPADILLTHPTVRRAIFEDLRGLRTNVDTAELAGGFKGFTFNGVPVYSDMKCKGGTMYALNSDSWAMHQLCDWTWLSGDDGGILKQIDGKAGYSATLVKYADLVCDKPFLQGKATNYSARKYAN